MDLVYGQWTDAEADTRDPQEPGNDPSSSPDGND